MPNSETAASIGKSVQIFGEVKGSEDLIVDGTVEGTITLTESRLTIGPNARVRANVSARDVVILGALTGNVTATGRVDLRAGSNLKGDIRAARLSIEENSLLSGKVELSNERPAFTPQPAAAAPQSSYSASTSPTTSASPSASPSSGALFGQPK
ncbi:MAG TPA: polymer-forming cytoskeletal protein [Silvibacterium sp.]|nr:polymer-forming cytoskeletal protein [Silvibacterium sp.]